MLLCDAAAVIAFDFGDEISSADHARRDGAGHPIEIRRGSRGLERDDEPGLAGRAHGKINSDLIRPNLGTEAHSFYSWQGQVICGTAGWHD
jgi:hypothetical protein